MSFTNEVDPSDFIASAMPHPDPELIALGVRQPWVELILRGTKTIEVRSRPTQVRGTIYLYASKQTATVPSGWEALGEETGVDTLPLGRLVGTVEITGCRPCTPQDARRACVPPDMLVGAFAWELANPVRLDAPLPVRFLPYGVWFYPFRRRREK